MEDTSILRKELDEGYGLPGKKTCMPLVYMLYLEVST
jgi:hypothetical protein